MRRSAVCALAFSLPFAMATAPSAASSGPMLVRDIATGTVSSNPTLARWGNQLILSGDDGSGSFSSLLLRTPSGQVRRLASSAGLTAAGPDGSTWSVATRQGLLVAVNGDLWRTDGTAAGTRDLGVYIGSGVAYADGLVFYEHPGPCAVQRTCDPNAMFLWVTDGTSKGTHFLGGPQLDSPLMAYRGDVYFAADSRKYGTELWRSDGTTGGTRLVRDINPGKAWSSPRNFAAVGGRLFFLADDGRHGRELWVTDGSTRGTHLVRDIRPGSAGSQPVADPGFSPVATGLHGVAYFAADDGRHGRELWRSDGTDRGTWLVRDFAGSSSPTDLSATGGRLWYGAILPGHGREPFVSDGSAAGTRLLRDVAAGRASSAPSNFTALGGQVYFAATSATGRELWRSDGTGGRTALARDIAPGPASSKPKQLLRIGSTLFFSAAEPVHGRELWSVRDGQVSLANDLNRTGASSGITGLSALGSRVCFGASSGAGNSSEWRTDGSAAGTFSVGAPGASSQLAADGGVYVLARTANGSDSMLWRSDCDTNSGTTAVGGSKQNGSYTAITTAGPYVYEGVQPATGTPHLLSFTGTSLVATIDINPFAGTNGPSPLPTVTVGNRLYILDQNQGGVWAVDDGTNARKVAPTKLNGIRWQGQAIGSELVLSGKDAAGRGELWVTDGTDAGTQQLYSTSDYRDLAEFAVTSGHYYFTVRTASGPLQLWSTDGTTAGTQMLIIVPPRNGEPYPTHAGDDLFFVERQSPGSDQLWTSDGTPAGTRELGMFQFIASLESTGNGALFTGRHTTSEPATLWGSDGTVTGTIQLTQQELNLTAGGTIRVDAGTVAFSASDSSHGDELWRTDGTPAGTQLVADINPGSAGSYPRLSCTALSCEAVATAGTLYFLAFTPTHGQELWTWTP